MADYDTILGRWFKEVDKKAQELKTKKTMTDTPSQEESAVEAKRQPVVAEVESRVIDTPASVVASVDTREVVAETEYVGEARSIATTQQTSRMDNAPAIFEESAVPPVEDFLSFLNRSTAQDHELVDELASELIVPEDQVKPNLSEGTGQPRPIISRRPFDSRMGIDRMPRMEPPVVENRAEVIPPVEVAPPVTPHVEIKSEPVPVKTDSSSLQEKWDRLPHHLQVLFGAESEEIAQNSYKPFRETRGTLIERLLDPSLSLEETARILNVCPTTVRRYTNRGVLTHYRTVGNQRRFKLSDILSFMESSAQKGKSASNVNSADAQEA